MKTLLLTLLTILSSFAVAQNQSADYNRLSAATKNAFSVAEREYTYKIEFKPGEQNSSSTANASSSSSQSSVSGNYSSYPAINVNQRRLEKQAEAGARQEARLASFDAKMNKLDDLISSRGLTRTAQNQAALYKAATDAGLTPYEASRFFGNSPQEYQQMLASKNASNYNWSGGVKGDCQGDCVENLTSPHGFTYTGNAKYGKPHGKGKMVGQTATYTGDFVAGEPNGEVEIRWNSGNTFTGTVWNGELTKGTLRQNGLTFKGTYLGGSYYRGLMKVSGMEMLGEFNKTPSFVMGMKAYANGDTAYGFFSGKDENPSYYELYVTKSGSKIETIYDNANKVIGDVRYYKSGSIFYGIPDSTDRKLGLFIKADGTPTYAYLNTAANRISYLENISPEQNKYYKELMEKFVNEVQRRREEYREKMIPIFAAVDF